MLDLKDEYIRNYAIDPEFITRKDSIPHNKDRISKERRKQRQLKKQFSFDTERSLADDDVPNNSTIENQVYSFCSVINPPKSEWIVMIVKCLSIK
jgi:hypothetical protein